MKVIDAHQHFWDRSQVAFDYAWQNAEELSPIRRNFLPDDLRPLIQEHGIDQTILVQTQHCLEENTWGLRLAERFDFIAGVVGWVDLAAADCEEQLIQFLDHPKFVGIRHVVQDEPDPDFIISDPVLAGLKVLERYQIPFDLLFFQHHLRHAPTVARRFPELPFVIDHLAKPRIRDREFKEWERQLADAAACDNVYCKLSGLVTEADWKTWGVGDLLPYSDAALELFTPRRVMFGSDWPVCELAASYDRVWNSTLELISGLSDHEQERVLGGTAAEFYLSRPCQETRANE